MGIKSRTFDIPSTSTAVNGAVPGDKNYRVKLTAKEKKRVEALIRNAKSLVCKRSRVWIKILLKGEYPVGGEGMKWRSSFDFRWVKATCSMSYQTPRDS